MNRIYLEAIRDIWSANSFVNKTFFTHFPNVVHVPAINDDAAMHGFAHDRPARNAELFPVRYDNKRMGIY